MVAIYFQRDGLEEMFEKWSGFLFEILHIHTEYNGHRSDLLPWGESRFMPSIIYFWK